MENMIACLWYDSNGEEAAKFYCSIFPNSKITDLSHYGKEGFEVHGRPEGSVMTVNFELNGNKFMALNGGPAFKFSEAVSFVIECKDQKEMDHYYNKLSADPKAEVCGWLKDRYGLSWQVVPKELDKMMQSKDKEAAGRVMTAMLQMKRLDLKKLKDAYEGK